MKLGGWLVMLTGMMLFLTFMGIPTGFSTILNTFGINVNDIANENITIDTEGSSFWGEIFGSAGFLAILISGGALIVGLFARSYDVSLIIAGFISFVGATYIQTFVSVIIYTGQNTGGQFWMYALVVSVLGSLMVGFAMACVDYFAGR